MEPRDVVERKLNKESEERTAKEQLYHYGTFLDNYQMQLDNFKRNLTTDRILHKPLVFVESKPYEDLDILETVYSDNKLLSRILATLGSICEEARYLVEEAQNYHYAKLIYYKDDNTEAIDSTGNLMEIMQKLYFFVNRCYYVIVLLLRQLCALLGKNLYKGASSTCFPEPLESLGELLVCLITLDHIIGTSNIKNSWMLYCKIIKGVLHNPNKFQLTLDSLRDLQECVGKIHSKLLQGKIFQQAVEKCLEENVLIVLKSGSISNEIYLCINQMLTELDKNDVNTSFIQTWMQVNALFVLYNKLFGNFDKKLYRKLSEINRKNIACTVYGNILWYPETFLLNNIPSLGRYMEGKSLSSSIQSKISLIDQNFLKDSHMLSVRACLWITDVRRVLQKDMYSLKEKDIQDMCDLITDGVKLVKRISKLTKWLLNLHVDEEKPITKSVLLALCRLIEVLKALQFTFHKNCLPLVYSSSLISQHLSYVAKMKLLNLKKSFTREKHYKQQQLDILSSLSVAENALKGPSTNTRILITKLALSASGISPTILSDVRSVINCLEVVCNMNNLFSSLSDGSFMYWHNTLLPVFFSKLVSSRMNVSRIYMILDAFEDNLSTVKDKNSEVMQNHIQKNLIEPLNQLIETSLRLQTHMHLQLQPVDPFEDIPPVTFKSFQPVKFYDDCINIKQEVEHYLSTTFYNLTTVVLHDWRTYGEMRKLAEFEYSLNTVEDNLPLQTLEQGLDVLEIMRNIDVFVEKYMYNLNNQVFIEEWSNNKHLNTIGISHVANSIRSHGIGIMNTTVNFTYQFLQNKFYIFSQFMFDEQIKSRLHKDLRYFMEHKDEFRQMYPYERADKFNVGIRKLGVNEEGLSYLDLFRKLITHIGNAMGYVRLIRSGGRRCLADGTCFIPDLQEAEELQKILDEGLAKMVKEAFVGFQRDVTMLTENFEDATEYFRLLLNVFAPVFRNPQNIHLKNFFVIVPPLTINFTQHILACKERLSKKNRTGAAFTDDGFAMGLAFIIELLDQTSQLNSLHWFHAVNAKIVQERKSLEEQKAKAHKEDDKLQQTLSLTEKRLNTFEKEFQLFYFNFNSAKIFFKS